MKTEKDIYNIFDTIKEVSIKYIDNQEKQFIGFSDHEIQELEATYKIQFPLAYKIFLKNMAKGSLFFFDAQLYNTEGITDAKEVAEELLEENEYTLPITAFPFSQWQGYQFYYFENEGVDPQTHLYIESKGKGYEPNIINYGSFTNWLVSLTIYGLKLHQQLYKVDLEEAISILDKLYIDKN